MKFYHNINTNVSKEGEGSTMSTTPYWKIRGAKTGVPVLLAFLLITLQPDINFRMANKHQIRRSTENVQMN